MAQGSGNWNSDPEVGSSEGKRKWHDRGFFREKSYVATIYGDSLRDNFLDDDLVGKKRAKLRQLKAAFNEEYSKKRPRLDVFLKIEAHLALIVPPSVTKNRFWAIVDRFERVVPAASRAQYWSSVPPKGDRIWADDQFIVGQARTLLDVIHANYLINMAREASTRRLKVILLAVFFATSLAVATGLFSTGGAGIGIAYAVLAYAGMLGAIMSIVQRLQKAVSHDAMVTDGIFELTGLRLGWLGLVLSVVSGGVFALVLYFTVMGGLFLAAVPAPKIEGAVRYSEIKSKLTAEIAADDQKLRDLRARPSPPPGAPTSAVDAARRALETGGADGSPAAPSQSGNAGDAAAIAAIEDKQRERQIALQYVRDQENATLPVRDKDDTSGQQFATSLGLADGTQFFRMLILAFLAGFAERFVPDILERLRKNMSP